MEIINAWFWKIVVLLITKKQGISKKQKSSEFRLPSQASYYPLWAKARKNVVG
jgi:hypothetical protein